MIKINELRIGNLVSTDGKLMNDTGIYTISSIASGDRCGDVDGCVSISFKDKINEEVNAWCKYLKPIPLTPELLEKCGFEYDNGKECWEMDGECIDINIHPKEIGIEVDYWENSLINCKYLHQLQNMYYAITNKELEVKL